jgi:hypothetical protein
MCGFEEAIEGIQGGGMKVAFATVGANFGSGVFDDIKFPVFLVLPSHSFGSSLAVAKFTNHRSLVSA